jgi:hypothetical protein
MTMYQYQTNSFGNRYITEVNRDTFNKTGAYTYLSTLYDTILLGEDTLYVIVGSDSGLLPKYLQEKGVPSNAEYLFIEEEHLLDTIQQEFPKHSQLHLCTPDEWQEKASGLNLITHLRTQSVTLVRSSAISEGLYPPYIELFQKIQKEYFKLDLYINIGTSSLFHFYRIALFNTADNQYSMSLLKNKLKGKTAIILGAAPSLDKHIDWVRNNQDKLYILTVSRLARKLKEESITPDFIVSVDPQPGSFHTSKEIFEFEQHSTFIHSYHGNQQLVGQWLGKKYYTGHRYPWRTKSKKDITPQSGSTVTNAALDTAILMGCSNILLAGVDFCFRSDGHTHASQSGTKSEEASIIATDDTYQMVTNNRGEEVETSVGFLQASEQFSQAVKNYTSTDQEVINLSDTAINMKHVSYQDTATIDLSSAPLKTKVEHSNESATKYYATSSKELKNKKRELNQIIRLCREITVHYEKPCNTTKAKKQLEKLEKRLEKNKDLLDLIKSLSSKEMLRVLRASRNEQSEWTEEEVTKSNIAYHEIIIQKARGLRAAIEQGIKRIKTRQLEQEEGPDHIEALFNGWFRDRQPRRAILWKQSHPDSFQALPDDEQEKVDQLIELHHDTLEEDIEEVYILDKEILPDTFKSLKKAINDRNYTPLNELLQKLKDHPDEEDLPISILFCEATLAYTNSDWMNSFELFAQLLNNKQKLTEKMVEFILDKIANISIQIGDYKNALLALETLSSSYSDHYIPIYAKLLQATGNLDASITAYVGYIKSHPEDQHTLAQLEEIYRENNRTSEIEKLHQQLNCKPHKQTTKQESI